MNGTASRRATRRTGPAHAPICMSKSRFNTTLYDGQVDELPADAISFRRSHGCRD